MTVSLENILSESANNHLSNATRAQQAGNEKEAEAHVRRANIAMAMRKAVIANRKREVRNHRYGETFPAAIPGMKPKHAVLIVAEA